MSDFTISKTVKTRKIHQCWGCEREYPTGSQMDNVCGRYDGDFFRYYLCKSCDGLIKKNHDLRDQIQDGFGSGMVKEFCEDEGIELPAMEG